MLTTRRKNVAWMKWSELISLMCNGNGSAFKIAIYRTNIRRLALQYGSEFWTPNDRKRGYVTEMQIEIRYGPSFRF